MKTITRKIELDNGGKVEIYRLGPFNVLAVCNNPTLWMQTDLTVEELQLLSDSIESYLEELSQELMNHNLNL